MASQKYKLIDKIFEIGILIKSFFGIFEVLAGIVLAVSGKLIMDNIIVAFTQQEVIDDPYDFFANYLVKVANNFSTGTHIFAVVYLIFHGVVNLFLAIALLKDKMWAYPWAVAGFGVFIIYQFYRYFHTYSPMLLILTAFDIFIVLMIFLEYNRKNNVKS